MGHGVEEYIKKKVPKRCSCDCEDECDKCRGLYEDKLIKAHGRCTERCRFCHGCLEEELVSKGLIKCDDSRFKCGCLLYNRCSCGEVKNIPLNILWKTKDKLLDLILDYAKSNKPLKGKWMLYIKPRFIPLLNKYLISKGRGPGGSPLTEYNKRKKETVFTICVYDFTNEDELMQIADLVIDFLKQHKYKGHLRMSFKPDIFKQWGLDRIKDIYKPIYEIDYIPNKEYSYE